MEKFLKSPLFWIAVIAVVAVAGYLLYNKYVSAPGSDPDPDTSATAPDTTDANPGSPQVDVGFADDAPAPVATSQSLPVSFRPYPSVPQNTIA